MTIGNVQIKITLRNCAYLIKNKLEQSTTGQEWEGPSKGTVFRGTNIESDVTVLRTLPIVSNCYEEPPGRAEEEDVRRDSNPRDHCEETLDYNQLSIHKVLWY